MLNRYIQTIYRRSSNPSDNWLYPVQTVEWNAIAQDIKVFARKAWGWLKDVAIASDINLQALHQSGFSHA